MTVPVVLKDQGSTESRGIGLDSEKEAISNMRKIGPFLIILAALMLSACQSTFGPDAIKRTHPGYNNAIANTLQQQMLLNLVRLKYREEPYFLKVSSITAAMSFSGDLGFGPSFDLAPGGNLIKPSFGIGYTDKPTVSYQPLQGEDFLKNVLSPISLPAILVLAQSGWHIERVFGLCIERINQLYNARTASGPTPKNEPLYRKFKEMLHLLHNLIAQRNIEMGPDKNNEGISILFKARNKTQLDQLNTLGKMLNFKISKNRLALVNLNTNFLAQKQNQLTIRTRSILSVMFYLAHNITVPKKHIDAGLVTITKTAQGDAFDWGNTPAGSSFKVLSSQERPKTAYLAIPYRNHWFYIEDNDLDSKTTFMLLNQLFDLQSGQTKFSGPTLTLPVR